MTKNIDDGKHAMIFVFTDCWEVIFWRKKRGKMPFFVFIDPYRTRPGTGKTCSLHVPPPVKITPKILANFASLNSNIAFGDLRLGGCLRGPQNSRGFCGLFWHTRIRGLYLRIYGSSSYILCWCWCWCKLFFYIN